MTGNPTDSFIRLNRTFRDLSPTLTEAEDTDIDVSQYLGYGRKTTWDDITKEFRVVILSEAGSGKTAEIRNLAQALRSAGKPSFFVRLEHVVDNFEMAFEEGSFVEFQTWIESGEEGWILLDSIDEARLHHPRDFEKAILQLARRLDRNKQRAHIILTGRATAWRPKSDMALCSKYLPFAHPQTTVDNQEPSDDPDEQIETHQRSKQGGDNTFKVFALNDLTQDQIKIFARARGLVETTSFLHSIERADAWSFTTRPQDLEELIDYWSDHARIGSRLELLRNSINRRLKERDQDRAELNAPSSDLMRRGARILAAASTMASEPTIRVPDGSRNLGGLQASEVLPSWSEHHLSKLLERPIFDEAIYGAVRFHHRSAREYLAAEWLASLLAQDTSRRQIEALLFKKQYGFDVIVPRMRPIVSWLAILDAKILERACKISPEVLLEGGDPRQLPLEVRQRILHQVCEKIANGSADHTAADHAVVQRFASDDLKSDIRKLIRKNSSHDDLLWFLLRMVWYGQIKEALPEAKSVAQSDSSPKYARSAAFSVIMAIGSPEDQVKLRETFLHESKELNRAWLSQLVKGLNPTPETTDWVLQSLRKTRKADSYDMDGLANEVGTFVNNANPELFLALTSGLNKLLDEKPFIQRKHCRISTKNSWLIGPASRLLRRMIESRSPATLTRDALKLFHKCSVFRREQADYEEEPVQFSKLVPGWPDLNRKIFWHEVATARRSLQLRRSEKLTAYWQVESVESFWSFEASDFAYVCTEITTRKLEDDKLVALSLAFMLYVGANRPRSWLAKLRKLVSPHPSLNETLGYYLKPRRQSAASRNWKRREAEWKRTDETRRRRTEEYHLQMAGFISNNVEKIRKNGLKPIDSISNHQHYLYNKATARSSSTNRWPQADWTILAPKFGEPVAEAFRHAITSYWRAYKPSLLSEGAELGTTPFKDIFGLSGIGIEAAEAPNWPVNLTSSEALLATRYALQELNGFPSWFPKLFGAFPETIKPLLLQEIRYELSIESSNSPIHYLLHDLSYYAEWSWDYMAEDLFSMVEKGDPKTLRNLTLILKIIHGSTSFSDARIASLAKRKIDSQKFPQHLPFWYAVWTGTDPTFSIPSLTSHIGSIATRKDQTTFAMLFVNQLVGRREEERTGIRYAYRTPEHLRNLYLLMLCYIRPDEDIDRVGKGIYSPELRDEAQYARSRLFELLREIPGKISFVELEKIATSHPDEASRTYFKRLLRSKAEADADITSWTPSDVREFSDKFERTPRNHRDLAELVTLRLLDLKDDLENGDSSIAAILRKVETEKEMRVYIGGWCRDRASGRYSIPQEEELADAKRTDFRFHGVGFDGPVPVELKLADNWNGPKLFERLEVQLCGDYLRDNRSNRGVFLLIYRGSSQRWSLPNSKKRVDFDGLVEALQHWWIQISSRFPKVDDITVVGINLTKRSVES